MGRRKLNAGYVLASGAESFLPIAAAREEGGQPVRRFRKDLIRVGQYVKKSAGLAFEVTRDRLAHWAATFSRMRENGVRVPVPAGHTFDPQQNRGWVQDMFVEGDRLIGVIDLVGDDAIAMAGRTDVSIYAPPEYTDGKGNQYTWPILHVALCTDPVVPGLGDFVPIAASQENTQPATAPVLSLEENAMPDEITPAVPATETGAELDPRDALKKAFRAKILKAIDDPSLDMRATIKAITELLKNQEAVLKKLEGMDPEPEASEAKTPDPMLVSLAADNRRMKLDGLVAAGKITPAVRDKLAAQFIGADNAALALSLSNGTGGQFDKIVAALMENDPVKLGEQTAAQAIVLASAIKKEEPNPLLQDAERRAAAMRR